eukprot:CAMPEP_0119511776 /NCGR_PEP_ID=MMETSP1344-20130328/30349_1 /TAXON_ID=236787 /ORGANISM="Florenciella parvula, Strain CCMP2471" /LENGTH=36 /DNA_ID= /DNA_START= /DNA_END= /DNA_ORIENTATION=
MILIYCAAAWDSLSAELLYAATISSAFALMAGRSAP